MKMLWLSLVFLIGVVETLSATIPPHLPIGQRFPPLGVVIQVGLVDGTEYNNLSHKDIPFQAGMGNLETLARSELIKLMDSSPGPLPGKEGNVHGAYAEIRIIIPDDLRDFPGNIARRYAIASCDSLVQFKGEKWIADDPSFTFKGWAWIPFPIPNLKQVEEVIRGPGRGVTITTTENGTPADCSLARGGGNWMGPNVLWLTVGSVLPELTAYRDGTITLYIGDDGEWGRYDIATGNLVARSDPPRQPVPISILPVPYQKSSYALQGTPEPGPRVKLLVTALQGSVTTVEVSTDLVNWGQFTTVTSQDGKPVEVMDTSTEKARFYRAWVPKTQ